MSHVKVFADWTIGHHAEHERELREYLDREGAAGYVLTSITPVVDPSNDPGSSAYVQLIVITDSTADSIQSHLESISGTLSFILEEIERK